MLFWWNFCWGFPSKRTPVKISNSYLEQGIKYDSRILPSFLFFFPFAFKHVIQDIIYVLNQPQYWQNSHLVPRPKCSRYIVLWVGPILLLYIHLSGRLINKSRVSRKLLSYIINNTGGYNLQRTWFLGMCLMDNHYEKYLLAQIALEAPE